MACPEHEQVIWAEASLEVVKSVGKAIDIFEFTGISWKGVVYFKLIVHVTSTSLTS